MNIYKIDMYALNSSSIRIINEKEVNNKLLSNINVYYLMLPKNNEYNKYLISCTQPSAEFIDNIKYFFNTVKTTPQFFKASFTVPLHTIFTSRSHYVDVSIYVQNNISVVPTDNVSFYGKCQASTLLTEENVVLNYNEISNELEIVINSLHVVYNPGNTSPSLHTSLGNVPIQSIIPTAEEFKIALDSYFDPQTWSDPIPMSIDILDDIKEGLRGRYLFTERPRNGLSNVVLDSFFPRLLYKHDLKFKSIVEVEKPLLPKTSCAISPFIASALNIKQIPMSQLIRILGYTEKDIKQLFDTVKAKELTFVFVGAGGTGLNTAVWLNNLSEVSNSINLFKKVVVYEKDNIEFSNLLRFPINPSNVMHNSYRSTKLDLISNYIPRLSKNKHMLLNEYIANNKYGYYYELFRNEWNSDKSEYNYFTREKVVLYGAPDLHTRANLSATGRFLSATHADNSCSIYLNPEQDTSIQVESYGMIQLNTFFMNQLHMAIKLLEILASDQDLNAKDILLDEFSFDGTIKKQTDREYNFHIETTTSVLTEQQAVTF